MSQSSEDSLISPRREEYLAKCRKGLKSQEVVVDEVASNCGSDSDEDDIENTQSRKRKRASFDEKDDEEGSGEDDASKEAFNEIRGRRYKATDDDLGETLDHILRLGEVFAREHKPVDIAKIRTLIAHAQLTRKVLADKYLFVTTKKKSTKTQWKEHPKTAAEVMKLLSGPAELARSWGSGPSSCHRLPSDGLLMRVTDEASKGKCYPNIGFLSQKSYDVLGTEKERKASLALHLDWKNRRHTSWISTSGDVGDFQVRWIPHMVARDKKRPSRCMVMLHFINGYSLLAAGWPVLRAREEMKYYKIEEGFYDSSFCRHEYVVPFRIPVDHIVGTYCWTVVLDYMKQHKCDYYQWHKAIVVPAFEEHEKARKENRKVETQAGCVCCGQ